MVTLKELEKIAANAEADFIIAEAAAENADVVSTLDPDNDIKQAEFIALYAASNEAEKNRDYAYYAINEFKLLTH